MRKDALGLFWDETDYKTEKKQTLLEEEGWVQVFAGFWAEKSRVDKGENVRSICMGMDTAYAVAKANKTGAKREPPDPVWLHPEYLPGLEEAREFNIPLLTDDELVDLSLELITKGKRHRMVFDIECYGNYYLIAFMSIELKKVTYLEISDDYLMDYQKLEWILDKFCLVGFNSINYDIVITALAVAGCSTAMMKSATGGIIEQGQRGWEILRHYKVSKLDVDHIDLIEVSPLFATLKIYGGRMHTRRMQDLPFHPNTVLSEPQRAIVRWYCVNDLRMTMELYLKIRKEIDLRESLSVEYGLDLRSKSDAQIAEAVMASELERLNHGRSYPPAVEEGAVHRYGTPHFIRYLTPVMQSVLQTVEDAPFIVTDKGNVGLPETLKKLGITMNQTTYKLGIGGLHSTEKRASHFASERTILKDVDVTSYYPFIILNLGLYPEQLGPNFLVVYRSIVERRVAAKQSGDKTTADALKIVINGVFGKLGSRFSIFYSPELLIQVTLTGQLSLLMLIERLELASIPVASANTDGIVIKCPVHKESEMNAIVKQWEYDTKFATEEVVYKALYSRDVNNYIAVKDPTLWKEDDALDDRVKTKGIFASPGLSKNPQNEVCIIAIKALLINNTPIEKTIRECRDITKFINVRTVKGGAVKLYNEGEAGLYLGKAIRWYYANDVPGEIVYASNGNKVPRSDGAQPLMDLPDMFPVNVNYDWYENETMKILKHMDYPL